jgi:hypothetical protein
MTAQKVLDLVFWVVLFVFAYSVLRFLRPVFAAKRHLSTDELLDFSRQRIDPASAAYTRFIGHLATCERCQERLNTVQKGEKDPEPR